MRFGTLCSGIGAPEAAWTQLGWSPLFASEIEPFPSAVHAHHYPDCPNLGDMTKWREWDVPAIDVLCAGTPCQSFSVAGLRGGLDDARGNLALEFCQFVAAIRPRWVVWENVPGVLSSNGGRDFGSILGALDELGYGWAYRVIDAQFVGGCELHGRRAVPQRRRRVFLVGHLGGWQLAAAVLFERESLRRDTPPRRETRQDVAPTISARPTGGGGLGTDFDLDGGLVRTPSHDPACTLTARDYKGPLPEADLPTVVALHHTQDPISGAICHSLGANANATAAVAYEHYTHDYCQDRIVSAQGSAPALNCSQHHHIRTSAVRRLTPTECERLQGFPDGYTSIPWRKKPADQCPDGPRYKALGNSMAVPVLRWIGERIAFVDSIKEVT